MNATEREVILQDLGENIDYRCIVDVFFAGTDCQSHRRSRNI